ncbi:MAG: DEAD/DEAH box helicase [Anaerolineae bacterium]|nr:DEAD/DEAH box helicase [Anaerolineae bacterium]
MPVTFAELGLNESTLKAISELGYEEPTPIQERTIRVLMEGADVIAQAQTGTGKTAAFALPIIEKIDPQAGAAQALVLTPTRELAVQVAEAFHSYGKQQRISVLPVYGGQPISRQLRALSGGVQIVVGTPGRILDHIQRGTLQLGQVRTVILDEADEMLDMGFIEDIETILKETPESRQTALFSATMPAAIVKLAQQYLHNPQRITVQAEQLTVPLIRQVYYEVGRRDKFEVLARILDYEQPTSAIIFCRTKLEVDSLGERLTARAYAAETLHGDLNQTQRDRVMDRFRGGQVELLVATDVAARGLDVEHVSHVINYDIPLDPQSYVHRIGRTGRAGRTGIAITLLTPRERRLWQMIQRSANVPIQRLHLPTIADVIARRREAFKEALRETITQNGLDQYRVMAEELSDEFSPTDLAAAAFKLLLGATPEVTEDKLTEPEEEPREYRDNAGRGSSDRSDRADRGSQRGSDRRRERDRFGVEPGMTRLYIDVGLNDGIRPADLVGAIANEANIPGRAIGAIDLFDHFSLVDVPANQAQQVIEALKTTKIRGRKISPALARPNKESAPRRREDTKRVSDRAGTGVDAGDHPLPKGKGKGKHKDGGKDKDRRVGKRKHK